MNIFKGAAWIFLATVLSQVINLLTLPYISRQYNESSLSSLGIITSVLPVLLIFSSFRLEFFIVKKDNSSALDFTKSLYFLTSFLALFYSFFLFFYLNYKEVYLPWYCLLLFIPYLVGVFWNNIITFSITRAGQFNHLAILKVCRASFLLVALFLFSFLQVTGIILSLLFSVLIPLLIYFSLNKKEFKGTFKQINLKSKIIRLELIKNYHAVIQAGFNVVNLQFFAFYVIAFESKKIIASYFFMEKIINAPLNLLASTLRQVVYKYFVDNQNDKAKLIKSYTVIQLALSLVAFVVGICIIYFGKPLIYFLLGSGWDEVSLLLNAYVFIVVMQIINIPSTSLYLTLDKISTVAKFEKIDLLVKSIFAASSIVNGLDIYEFIKIASFYVIIYYCFVSAFLYRYLLKR